MKRVLFILFLTILFIGCEETKYIKEYYETGQVEAEGTLKGGEKEGLWKHYYEHGNDQLWLEINWKGGKLEGVTKAYHPNGQLGAVRYHKDNELEGPYLEFYDNGQLKSEMNYKEGYLTSDKCWDEHGNQKEHCE